ncbi:MAG: metal ABC transporter permease [Erysipelotrichaceae bacterium]
MSMLQVEIMIIASLVSVACSLVGVFLVLKKMSMMSDAITHTVLLGIVLAFFAVGDLSSPWLLVGASIVGLITVYLVEGLKNTKLLAEEAAIGVVFPFIFSIAIVLISTVGSGAHLDTDAVLLGELAFAPLDRIILFGISIPSAYINAAIVLLINIVVIAVLFKEFKIASFDPVLAAVLGFSPVVLNYLLMSLVSLTAVSAFSAVGSILVIAFMIGPPISAYLLTNDLKKMIFISCLFAIFNVVIGYQISRFFDVSIAGSMALMTGISFVFVFMFSHSEGYITKKIRSTKQKKQFNKLVILFLLEEYQCLSISDFTRILGWKNSYILKVLKELKQQNYLSVSDQTYCLTESGFIKIQQEGKIIFDH